MPVNRRRLSTVANRSSREPDSVRVASPRRRMVSCSACPLPPRFAAPVRSSSDSAPSALAPPGPNAVANPSRLAYNWSNSTGVAVRSLGITALSPNRGPPTYTGANCTYRSLTTLGATTTARACSGTATARSTDKPTRTRSPSGTTSSTEPTRTPNTRTSDPTYTPTAEEKYAVIRRLFAPRNTHHRAPATTRTSTQASASTLLRS